MILNTEEIFNTSAGLPRAILLPTCMGSNNTKRGTLKEIPYNRVLFLEALKRSV